MKDLQERMQAREESASSARKTLEAAEQSSARITARATQEVSFNDTTKKISGYIKEILTRY